jgi:hypothetical protein
MGIGIIGIGIVAGVAVVIVNHSGQPNSTPVVSIAPPLSIPAETVHTADWYVAHPDVLKADDIKCGSDAASIPQAACQNAATADQRLLAAKLGQAATANESAAPASPAKPQ